MKILSVHITNTPTPDNVYKDFFFQLKPTCFIVPVFVNNAWA
jgi:hypothetical protein